MPLTPGTRLGPYEVTAQIGVGGMGEVYRATDTNLARPVAIKVLPEAFAHDPDRLARFEREAKTLASLNHPNIAQIYGLEKSGGMTGLVMELVEGPTLADRIAQGAVPLDDARPIAKQIAEALEAAHEQGIIHRDLKPANIKVRSDGTVKVLDFGLAKAMESPSAMSPSVSQAPTITTPAMTQAGMILGTAAYMSPEQARGKTVDKRADIWAFGCVLYEMLTGQRAFPGEDVTDTLAAVVRSEPVWDALPRELAPSLRVFLRRCVQKDPRQRVGDMRDVRLALEGAFEAPSIPAPQTTVLAANRTRRVVLEGALATAVLALAVLAVVHFREAAPTTAPEFRTEMVTPPTTDPVSLSLSPDGQKIVFVASAEGRPMLWLRSLTAGAEKSLPGTAGGAYPFWSPDSRSVGFFADGQLKRIDVVTGTSNVVTPAANGRGGSWNRDGVMLFAWRAASTLVRVPESGGEPAEATTLAPGEVAHRFPQFLPDGDHFLYFVDGSPQVRGIYVGQLSGGTPRRLVEADSRAVLASSLLLYLRQGIFLAQRFDVTQLSVTGDPVPVTNQPILSQVGGGVAITADAGGRVAYRAGAATLGERQFVWFDRSGRRLGSVGEPDTTSASPSLSPDGRIVAFERNVDGNSDIWMLEIARGVLRRFTSDAGTDSKPVWSPDGQRIAFNSSRSGPFDLYVKSIDDAGKEELVLKDPEVKTPVDWSSDGVWLLYRTNAVNGSMDLWALRLEGERKPLPFARAASNERDGQFSPDGRWVAYQSDESGQFEVYVQRFPGPGEKWQVSTHGGAQVRWRRDGKELFYLGLDGTLMAVPFNVPGAGSSVEAERPVPLFPVRVRGGPIQTAGAAQYTVSPDGNRFLVNEVLGDEMVAAPITVILNWQPPL